MRFCQHQMLILKVSFLESILADNFHLVLYDALVQAEWFNSIPTCAQASLESPEEERKKEAVWNNCET